MKNKYKINAKEKLYYMKATDIEKEAEEFLREYMPQCLENNYEVAVENLLNKLNLRLALEKLSVDNSTLGVCTFNKGIVEVYDEDQNCVRKKFAEKTIIIDKDLYEEDNGRLRFTIAHEIGHFVLQYGLRHNDERQISLFDNNETKLIKEMDTNEVLFIKKLKDIPKFSFAEWQANSFAAALLVPKVTLDKYIKNKFNLEIIPKNYFTNFNQFEYNHFLYELADMYNVSFEMIKIRMDVLGYDNKFKVEQKSLF